MSSCGYLEPGEVVEFVNIQSSFMMKVIDVRSYRFARCD
jgi:hypothetical protein